MILCKENDLNDVLNFIGKRYGECLYLYLDILKYGFTDENIHLWCQKKNDKIVLLVLQYYTGMHIFMKDKTNVDFLDLISLIKERNPSMICGMETTIQLIKDELKGYELEVGYVGTIKELKDVSIDNCRLATREDLRAVAEFLSTDDALGKPYGFELLYKQLLERYDQNYGRTFILEEDGQIIGTASTYAETHKCAVVSGVLIHENYRGKGLSRVILTALCKNLLENEFDVFSYYYIEQAIRMHKSVGFEDIGQWAKLVKE